MDFSLVNIMKEKTFSEEIFEALECIYVKHTIPNGKSDIFVSWPDLEDFDLTEYGVELQPDYEYKINEGKRICLYGSIGTIHISTG